MQARYYDPVIGRFYSNDPVGFDILNVHTFGRYTYGNNNPYKFVDPNGESAANAFEQLSSLFQSPKKQVNQIRTDAKALANRTSEGLKDGGKIVGEATKESLGPASTVTGFVPGAQGLSLALAGADLIFNDNTSSLSSAGASGITDSLTSDMNSKGIVDTAGALPKNKVEAAKAIFKKAVDYAVPQLVGFAAGEADNIVTEQNKEKSEN